MTISRRRWIVLNEHERKTLREVERRLQAEDPRFTRSFEARQTRMARHPHKRAADLAVGAAALLAAVTLLAGRPGATRPAPTDRRHDQFTTPPARSVRPR
jgi:hypothetical protein